VILVPCCQSVHINVESSVMSEFVTSLYPSAHKFASKDREMIRDQAEYVNIVGLSLLACLVMLKLLNLFESGFTVT
jgi:hypothetical protein